MNVKQQDALVSRNGGRVMTLTIDDIMALDPCSDYPRERVKALMGGRESMALGEILLLEKVPAMDRVWVYLNARPDRAVALANRWADRAVSLVRETSTDERWNAWADGWLSGADRSLVAATHVWAAARAAARAACVARTAEAEATAIAAWQAAESARAAALTWPEMLADCVADLEEGR